MNVERINSFLTKWEKTALHFYYPDKIDGYNILNSDMSNAIKGLINLGLMEETKDNDDKAYKLTEKGRQFCDIMLS